jgi:peptidoglycan hydrolase-like protein with peptidoglycan-binding domain
MMNRQAQWLFEVPPSLETPRYLNFEFNEEYAESPVLEALWETAVVVLRSDRFRDDRRLQSAANNRPAMRIGERGIAVQKLQQALIDRGFPIPISVRRQGSPDGIYGNETASTVSKFQSMHGLQIDGIAGRQTLSKLDELFPKPNTIPPGGGPPVKSCKIISHLEDTGLIFRRILGDEVPMFRNENIAQLLAYAVGLPQSAAPEIRIQPGDIKGLIAVLNVLLERTQTVGNQCQIPTEEVENIKKRVGLLRAFYQGQVDGSQTQVVLKRQIMVSIALAEIGKVKSGQPEATSLSTTGCRKRFGWQRLEKYFEVAYGDPKRWDRGTVQCSNRSGLPHWCGIFTLWAIKNAGVNICNWGGGISHQIRRVRPRNEPLLAGDIGYIHGDVNKPHRHHCMVVLVQKDGAIVTIDGNSSFQGGQVQSNVRPKSSFTNFYDVDTALPLCPGQGETGCPKPPNYTCIGGKPPSGVCNVGGQVACPPPTGFNEAEITALKITTRFENNKEFGCRVSQVDGISMGMIQWNLKAGTLQKMLKDFDQTGATARVFRSRHRRTKKFNCFTKKRCSRESKTRTVMFSLGQSLFTSLFRSPVL